MSEFPVEDHQRDAAVAYLRDEHARGAFDRTELERRTAAASGAESVAELLAATAPVLEPTPAPPRPVKQSNTVALVAGVALAILVALVLLSRLG